MYNLVSSYNIAIIYICGVILLWFTPDDCIKVTNRIVGAIWKTGIRACRRFSTNNKYDFLVYSLARDQIQIVVLLKRLFCSFITTPTYILHYAIVLCIYSLLIIVINYIIYNCSQTQFLLNNFLWWSLRSSHDLLSIIQ